MCVEYAAVVPEALMICDMTPKALLGSRANFLPAFVTAFLPSLDPYLSKQVFNHP